MLYQAQQNRVSLEMRLLGEKGEEGRLECSEGRENGGLGESEDGIILRISVPRSEDESTEQDEVTSNSKSAFVLFTTRRWTDLKQRMVPR